MTSFSPSCLFAYSSSYCNSSPFPSKLVSVQNWVPRAVAQFYELSLSICHVNDMLLNLQYIYFSHQKLGTALAHFSLHQSEQVMYCWKDTEKGFVL